MTQAIDVPDFITPTNEQAQGRVLYSGLLVNGGTVSAIDTSQFASLIISAQAVSSTAGAVTGINISQFIGSSEVSGRVVTFPSRVNVTPDALSIMWAIPVDGTSAQFLLATTEAGNVQVAVIGSTRPIAAPSVRRITNSMPALINEAAISVPANSNSTVFYAPPTDYGYAAMYETQASGNVTLRVQAYYMLGTGIASDFLGVYPTTNSNNTDITVPVAGVGTEWYFYNATSAAVTCSLRVWELAP